MYHTKKRNRRNLRQSSQGGAGSVVSLGTVVSVGASVGVAVVGASVGVAVVGASVGVAAVSYTHLTLPTNREV